MVMVPLEKKSLQMKAGLYFLKTVKWQHFFLKKLKTLLKEINRLHLCYT